LPELKLTFLPAKAETTRSDLILDIVSAKKGLRGSVVYSTDLYNTSTIERIIFDFELILQNIVIHPDISLLELSGILTETEKQRWVNREKQINEVSLRKLGNARRKAGDRSRSIKVID
jgi:non-ribosomal peptide synthetase component F